MGKTTTGALNLLLRIGGLVLGGLRRGEAGAIDGLDRQAAPQVADAHGLLSLGENQPGQGGPRYQWSRRVGKKTVTVALSAEQFVWLKWAIVNQPKVWDILTEMQHQTVAYMWKNLAGTSRRNRLSKKMLGLN